MPFLIPVIAAVGAAVGTVATAISFGVATLGTAFGLEAGLAITLGDTVASIALSAIASTVLGALSPHPNLNGGAQVQFTADKNAGVPYLVGRTGSAGNIVFIDTSNDGHNKWIHYFVVFSTGPVDSFQGFTANQTAISFTSGAATTSPYNGKMWLTTQVGTQPSSVLAAPSGTGTVPEWTSSHKLSGLAAARWVLQSDQKTYPAGPPQPLWVWKGALVYDPRLDSTYPGGSGSQRSGTPSTWTWSENPYLHALTWCLGQTSNGIRTVGLGAPISAIDVASFVTGANVADANGWKCGGAVSSQDSKWDVLTAMLQAGGGTPVRQGNQISCIVSTPLVSVATLTGAEVVGEAQITGSQPRRSRINSVTPTYRSETHKWEQVAADPVTISAYVTADGQKRSKAITWALVQSATQVAQLAYYSIADAREFTPVTLPLKARWNALKPGDCITIADSELGMSSQTLMVLTRQRDPATGMPTFTCRSETTAKHAAALAMSGSPPPTPSLSAVDLVNVPAPGAGVWTSAGVTLSDAGTGQQTSALQVTGAIDNPNASGIVVEYSVASSGVWIAWPVLPASTTTVNITGMAPNTSYDVRVSYIQRGNQGSPATATGSPTTSGAGATINRFAQSGVVDTATYTNASGVSWLDCTSVTLTNLFLGGTINVDTTALLSSQFGTGGSPNRGSASWRLISRLHSGGGDLQVLASGTNVLFPTSLFYTLNFSSLASGSGIFSNTATVAGDRDFLFQIEANSVGGFGNAYLNQAGSPNATSMRVQYFI